MSPFGSIAKKELDSDLSTFEHSLSSSSIMTHSSDDQPYLSRNAWFGESYLNYVLSHQLLENSSSTTVSEDLKFQLQQIIATLPYSECIRRLDHLQPTPVLCGGNTTVGQQYKVMMFKIGVIAAGGDWNARTNLDLLIRSMTGYTGSSRENGVPNGEATHTSRRSSGAANDDTDEDDAKKLPMYTLSLQRWEQDNKKIVHFSRATQTSIDPPRWRITVNVDGREFTAEAKSKPLAKHYATRDACDGLGIRISDYFGY